MYRNNKTRSWALIAFVIVLLATTYTAAQKNTFTTMPHLTVDPAPPADAYPFDYIDEFYGRAGINVKLIVDRKTGSDGMSVFDKPLDPMHNFVRITATIPAYGPDGRVIFWYSLGSLPLEAFTDDSYGNLALRAARQNPIYVFPHKDIWEVSGIAESRQSPIISDPISTFAPKLQNPLGLRQILRVTYTELAFEKDAFEIMTFFAKKNGLAADDTPVIRSVDDMEFLAKHGLIAVDPVNSKFAPPRVEYVMAPLMVKGGYAPDSFLMMIYKYGEMLPAERFFMEAFNCVKKTGDICKEF